MLGLPSPGVIGATVAVSLVWTGGVYLYGRAAGADDVKAAVAQAVAAEQQRQATAIDASLDNARRDAETAEAENIILEEKVRAYEAEIASRPDACVIGDDDARRLRDIR